jgi:hypothetical protein
MLRVIAALAFVLISTSLAEAIATAKVVLNSTAWSDLGVGPALIGPTGHVVFLIDDTAPTTGLQQGLGFPINGGTQCLNTTSHVWAMAADAYPAWVFVAPVVGC